MTPPRPHPFTRSSLAERLDRWIAAIWRKGWDEKPPLEPDYLWQIGSRGYEEADEISVRSEEDVADFRLRLEQLCQALRDEADLNALGHTMAYGQLTSAIRKRHALGRLWRQEPELAHTTIAPPIVVLGQMRSGTTRVQRLLAADPAHAGTRFCDSHDPVPSTPDLRAVKSRAALVLAHWVNPWLETMHPIGATRTDEEIGWLSAALSPVAFEAQWRIPSYVAFSEARDPAPVYREFARILRTDAAHHGNALRPRVLKCPQFAQDAPALLSQFPDARIVACHRVQEDVLASSVSMVASQMAFQSDSHELAELQDYWRARIAQRSGRMRTFLDAFSGPVARMEFAELNHNWRAAMTSAYGDLGIGLGNRALAAMELEVDRADSDRHREHRRQIGAILSS
ncbi:sulfotransferase [Qipengyuania aurantiaca]|uniref:Sulfotransferase n=1 Tax=Qipengyuania aurantiaca TaxID=2867233 RepID=A0ABX8ZMT0_9SPHN|nr:sulfotransferase [Qipengyuania aurantiaca]QZD90046.1 sulfotransferase [Qipengyuania aurantiaca]